MFDLIKINCDVDNLTIFGRLVGLWKAVEDKVLTERFQFRDLQVMGLIGIAYHSSIEAARKTAKYATSKKYETCLCVRCREMENDTIMRGFYVFLERSLNLRKRQNLNTVGTLYLIDLKGVYCKRE